MNRKVTSLSTLPKLAKRVGVAAYARVSNGKEAMLQSLNAKVNYYKKLIMENPIWDFDGIYSDEATTGTKDSRRKFQQMLKDCREGSIAMIITEAISMFARNTVTLLETIRELKAIHVDVFFKNKTSITSVEKEKWNHQLLIDK